MRVSIIIIIFKRTEKVKKQRWTVDELEILKVYAQKLEPDEKANYAEVCIHRIALPPLGCRNVRIKKILLFCNPDHP
jgi:hypothetical protein